MIFVDLNKKKYVGLNVYMYVSKLVFRFIIFYDYIVYFIGSDVNVRFYNCDWGVLVIMVFDENVVFIVICDKILIIIIN